MKLITEQKIQETINVLAEFPAKHTFNTILMLQNLPVDTTQDAKVTNKK